MQAVNRQLQLYGVDLPVGRKPGNRQVGKLSGHIIFHHWGGRSPGSGEHARKHARRQECGKVLFDIHGVTSMITEG